MAAIMKINVSKYTTVGLVALLSLIIFVIPYSASLEYSLRGKFGKGHDFTNYLWIFHQDGFLSHLSLSLELGLLAGLLNLVLMVPTATFLHLSLQRYKPVVDFICILPLMIPVVSLAVGAEYSMPGFLQNSQFELVFFFVILALPFTFRVLDSSLSSIPLKTLVEASRSLGASWPATIVRVIVPAASGGISSAFFLSFALGIGEYTITSLLHWDTFTTWTVDVSQQNVLGSIALSTFSFLFAVILLIVIALVSSNRKKKQKELEEQS
jgi:putative spermidine/putrescine transport system permease protein